MTYTDVDLDLAHEVMDDLHIRGLLRIVRACAEKYHATVAEVCSRARPPHVSRARFAAWAKLHRRGLSHVAIAKLFRRNPTTVLSGISMYRDRKPRGLLSTTTIRGEGAVERRGARQSPACHGAPAGGRVSA